jgi:hypothetical protein
MDATQATAERLIEELWVLEEVGVEIHSGDGLFGSFLNGKHRPAHRFTLDQHLFFRLDSEQWTVYTRPDSVQRVRFLRGPDPDAAGKERRGVLLFGLNKEPTLTFTFGHLYDEQGEPIAARFALWEELRAKYGGHDELRVENGRLTPWAEGER